jgi:hypothetical protein
MFAGLLTTDVEQYHYFEEEILSAFD